MTSKLERLEKQRSQLEARIRAAKAKETQRERKADTRRKILVGACVMARMETNDLLRKDVMRWLEKDLKRDVDRAMFGWTPLKASDSDQNKSQIEKAS